VDLDSHITHKLSDDQTLEFALFMLILLPPRRAGVPAAGGLFWSPYSMKAERGMIPH
jgi:hypothetical protein